MEPMKKSKIGIQLLSISAGLALSLVAVNVSATNYFRVNQMGMRDSWTGVYFGASFGAGAGDVTQSYTFNSTTNTVSVNTGTGLTVTTDSFLRGSNHLQGHATGSVADVFIGYNFFLPCSLVFGAQLEGTVFSDVTLKNTGLERATADTAILAVTTATGATVIQRTTVTPETLTVDTHDELRSMYKLVGRAGYLVTPCTLLYALGGAVEGNFVVPASSDDLGDRRSKWELGYTLGAGIEQKLNEHWSVRVEYRYIRIDIDRSLSNSSSSSARDTLESSSTTQNFFSQHTNTKFHDHIGEFSIVYRFC